MSQSIYVTNQTTFKRAMIASAKNQNILVWAGEDKAINLSNSPFGIHDFKTSRTKYYTEKSPYLIMSGNGENGYLFWTSPEEIDDGYQILYAEVKWDASGKLVVSDLCHMVPSGISADGIIAAMWTVQNGQLVVNLGWKDPKKHLCLAQIEPWRALPLGGADFRLDEKTNAGPFMTTIGGRPIMAYFDDNKHLNIVLARKNTINFDFKNKAVFKSITSSYAPCIVAQSTGIGYVFWRNYNGGTLNYQQIGMNSFGDIVMNSQIEGSGVIDDARPNSAPFARLIFREKDDHHKTMLQVIWAQTSNRRISIAEFDAHFTALT